MPGTRQSLTHLINSVCTSKQTLNQRQSYTRLFKAVQNTISKSRKHAPLENTGSCWALISQVYAILGYPFREKPQKRIHLRSNGPPNLYITCQDIWVNSIIMWVLCITSFAWESFHGLLSSVDFFHHMLFSFQFTSPFHYLFPVVFQWQFSEI